MLPTAAGAGGVRPCPRIACGRPAQPSYWSVRSRSIRYTDRERYLDSTNLATTISAVAQVLGALAWPVVATIGLYRFSPEIRNLFQRIRKGAGAEFDPPSAQQLANRPAALPGASSESSPSQLASPAPSVPFERTPAILGWEESIRKLPAFAEAAEPAHKIDVLVNSMARMMLTYVFDTTDLLIYSSQVELLLYLNTKEAGESVGTLRAIFFEPARKQHPEIYDSYSFDPYIEFLRSRGLITILDDTARITAQGREYLVWRVQMNKPAKVTG